MSEKKSNIPTELAGAASANLKFDPQDPATAELVKEFIAQKQDEAGPLPPPPPPEMGMDPAEAEGAVGETQTHITPNQEFDGGDPSQQFISEAMSPIDRIEITAQEKEIFLKAVLNDVPVRLPVRLYNNRLTIEIRSRSSFEQKRVFDVLKKDKDDKLYEDGDVAMMVTRMHYYLGSLMVERVNGDLFSELQLNPGSSLEEDTKKLRTQAAKLFENMSNVRWTSILNALRIFEHKCAKMNAEAANEGFWIPQG